MQGTYVGFLSVFLFFGWGGEGGIPASRLSVAVKSA